MTAPADLSVACVLPPSAHHLQEAADADLVARLLADLAPGDGLAGRVLERTGGLARLARMGAAELRRELAGLEGWAPPAGDRLLVALELGRRALRSPLPRRRVVRAAHDLEAHLRGLFDGGLKEAFVVVLLDAQHRPLRTEPVSVGCLTWSVVHPREVFAPAVREAACAIIVGHNHPSGDPRPSRQDIDLTQRLVRVGEVLGIPLLDHVVVGRERLVSMRAEGWME